MEYEFIIVKISYLTYRHSRYMKNILFRLPCEYNVPRDQRYSLLYHREGSMLDHVLVSNTFYPYWSETNIFNELLPDESEAFASDIFPDSDHAPLVTRFLVPDSWLP